MQEAGLDVGGNAQVRETALCPQRTHAERQDIYTRDKSPKQMWSATQRENTDLGMNHGPIAF